MKTAAPIGLGPHFGIADIGQVIGLGALADHRLLDFHEIADVGVFADFGTGPQPGVGADAGTRLNGGAFDMAESVNFDIVPHPGAGSENHVGTDHHILADSCIGGEEYGFGCSQRRTVQHVMPAVVRLQSGFDAGELQPVVDARHFRFGAFLEAYGQSFGDGVADQIGEVEFVLGIVVGKARNELP
jgi:hypothetical protein